MVGERILGYVDGFKVGLDNAIELVEKVVEKVVDDFCFGDTEESIEVQRSLKEAIKFAILGLGEQHE